ncbi:hypothetical protein D915_009843 [Fasciola hepatica]|uniref:Uncharacterized protein n=1 Tax=Fasciola hepatica TaxID=6192 RepID=A0A4E0RC38_FASHE|nr:hypothetical protein D915_009843 [Fasciola hepatica]
MFTVVVNKVVRGLSWTESIPLTSAVTVLGNKCRRRWRARRTQLSGPRYVRVRMDSPRASLKMNSPSVPLQSPVSTPPGSEFKIYDSDSQDEVLLDVKDEISLRN